MLPIPQACLRLAVLLPLAALAAVPAARAELYYVAPAGSDANDCSQARPCRQIRRALTLVAAGDTIVVADGTYLGFTVSELHGAAGAPITIHAPGGAADVLRTTDRSDNAANVLVSYSSYVELVGLRSFDAPQFGVRVSHSDHVAVRRGVFGNNGTHGIFTGHSDDLLIEDNECYGSRTSHGIYVSNSGDRPVVRRNRAHDNYKAGIQLNADVYSGGDGLISGALIESNVIWGNGSGSAAINLDGVQDSVVRNNLLYGNHGTAIALFQIDGAEGPRNVQLLHNTVDVPSDGRTGLSIKNTTGAIVVRDNVLCDRNSGAAGLKFGNASDLANSDSDYNVLDRVTPDDGSTLFSLAQWKAQGHEPHSLSALPPALWKDEAAGDYHLAAGSPAVDRGQTLASVVTDLEGNARPAGAASDVGAYEAAGVPSLAVSDARVSEGDGGAAPLAVQVTLSQAASAAVTVSYATVDGTATAPGDYVPASGTLRFEPGVRELSIPLAAEGDTSAEGDEVFALRLSAPSGAVLADAEGLVTIVDDDAAAAPSVSVADASRAEGQSGSSLLTFTVSLSSASSVPVTVQYRTSDGTASAGSDYDTAAGTLTFPAGALQQSASVVVRGDTAPEPDETFAFDLVSASGATLARARAAGTIQNDDNAPAQMLSPAPGSTLTSSTVTFSWTAGSGVTQYWLSIGTRPRKWNVYSASLGTALSATVSGLPGGRTLYVRLRSRMNGAWVDTTYTYTSAGF